MTRITLQYFFMVSKSSSMLFLPSSSPHFLLDLVKAFFLDLHLYLQTGTKMDMWTQEETRGPTLMSAMFTQWRISTESIHLLDNSVRYTIYWLYIDALTTYIRWLFFSQGYRNPLWFSGKSCKISRGKQDVMYKVFLFFSWDKRPISSNSPAKSTINGAKHHWSKPAALHSVLKISS